MQPLILTVLLLTVAVNALSRSESAGWKSNDLVSNAFPTTVPITLLLKQSNLDVLREMCVKSCFNINSLQHLSRQHT